MRNNEKPLLQKGLFYLFLNKKTNWIKIKVTTYTEVVSMKELMKKHDYKITYGKSVERWDGIINNWIGILPQSSITNDTYGYRIGYIEKDGTIIINSVTNDHKSDEDISRMYFVFPLLKLIEKAKKKGIKEVLVSAATKNVDKALKPFFDVEFTDNNRNRKFILNKERMLEIVGLIEVVTYHPAVWEIRHISSNIMFRTKTGYMDIVWEDREETFQIREKEENNIFDFKSITPISKSVELEEHLRKHELVETFKPMYIERAKRMFHLLDRRNSNEIEESELNNFYNQLEKHMPLETIEQKLMNMELKERFIYKKKIYYYDFGNFLVGKIDTTHFGTKKFIEKKNDLQQVIFNCLNEDLKEEISKLVV